MADMESKGHHVSMKKKNKFLVSGDGHNVLKKFGKYPCAVCCNGVSCSSILCSQCILWIHKKYSRITKRLALDENYVFPRCKGESRPIYGRTVTEVDVEGTILDVEIAFCYVRGMVCSVGAVTVPLMPYVV